MRDGWRLAGDAHGVLDDASLSGGECECAVCAVAGVWIFGAPHAPTDVLRSRGTRNLELDVLEGGGAVIRHGDEKCEQAVLRNDWLARSGAHLEIDAIVGVFLDRNGGGQIGRHRRLARSVVRSNRPRDER